MRSARTVVRQTTGSAAALVVVVLTSLGGAVACEQPMFDTSRSSRGGTASGGAFVFSGAPSVTPVGGEGALPSGCNEYPIDPPAGGATSVEDEICSASMEPVLANAAAQIRLVLTNDDPRLPTSGILTFPEGVRGHVNGEPVVSVARAMNNLDGVITSAVAETPEGYAFSVTFGPDALLISNDQTRVSLRATFDYRCEDGSRLVNAVTQLRLCGGFPTPVTWSGPGDTCVVCYESQPRPNP